MSEIIHSGSVPEDETSRQILQMFLKVLNDSPHSVSVQAIMPFIDKVRLGTDQRLADVRFRVSEDIARNLTGPPDEVDAFLYVRIRRSAWDALTSLVARPGIVLPGKPR